MFFTVPVKTILWVGLGITNRLLLTETGLYMIYMTPMVVYLDDLRGAVGV